MGYEAKVKRARRWLARELTARAARRAASNVPGPTRGNARPPLRDAAIVSRVAAKLDRKAGS